MPIFTAAATYIVASIGITGAAAVFATAVIATGLAIVTARLVLGSPGGRAQPSQDKQGFVRVQVPPATNNKVPIVYGQAFQQGIVTDARISNDFQTMKYVIVLSEKTQTGTFTLSDIFYNDQKLVFKTGAGEEHIVASSIENYGRLYRNGTAPNTNTNYDGLIKIRVYSGNTNSSSQIFPTTNATSALTFLGESDANYLLNDLIFAVVELTYNSEKGVTALAPITFKMNNTLKNPGNVWYDFITSTRYGAGIPVTQVNTNTSINSSNTLSLTSISNQIPANQTEPYPPDDPSTTVFTASNQVRYEINGVIETGDTVKTNLEKINLASASWTTFDHSLGQWTVIPNRAATAGELTNAFIFNDDNIIGDISITATSLEDLYNALEVEFPNRIIADQPDYYRSEIAAGLRNDNEPDNRLGLKVDLVNNALHAGRIGELELKQSRVDKIIAFRADYSALQVDIGDVVKVTSALYGFDNKLFRVTRTREIEDEAGNLAAEITAIEYDDGVYDDETLADYVPPGNSEIPTYGGSSLPAPSAPVLSNSNPNANTPNFTISTTINAGSQPVESVEWFYSSSSGGTYIYLDNERATQSEFTAGQTISDVITTLGAGTWYFKARTTAGGGRTSNLSAASTAFVWSPNPAGANNGTINTSTFASEILISEASSGTYKLTMVPNLNDFEFIYGDPNLTFDAASNVLSLPNISVTTITATNATITTASITSKMQFTALSAEPATYSTGTLALADSQSWDPASTNNNHKYLTLFNGTKWVDLGSNAIYGQFITTGSISIATSTNVVAITFDQTDINFGVTLTTSSHINVLSTGTYMTQFSAVFENTDNNAHRAILWYRKNGADIPDSATAITVPARHGSIDGTAVMTVPLALNLNQNDYIELYWSATDPAISIATISSSTVAPIYPRTPGVILTVHKVAGGSS